jgi:hypothetical protein
VGGPEVLEFEDDFLEGRFLRHSGFSIYDFGLRIGSSEGIIP